MSKRVACVASKAGESVISFDKPSGSGRQVFTQALGPIREFEVERFAGRSWGAVGVVLYFGDCERKRQLIDNWSIKKVKLGQL
jgi:hypothetical protein